MCEAENSITLTICNSESVFIALGWHSEMIMGFHEYACTYQNCEYKIRAMNILWPEVQLHSDNCHVHATAVRSACALAQACPAINITLAVKVSSSALTVVSPLP